MTQKEYEERNAKGYEGDTFIHGEIEKLVKKYDINLIIETGTYHGATSKRLSEFAHVISFEVNKENFKISKENTKTFGNKITLFNENSVAGLKNGFGLFQKEKRLYFLDAHWWDHCPLLEELELIAKDENKPVIVIHDFKVPGKDFGFDSYKGQDFTFEWIKPSIEAIYGKNYDYHFNDKADGGYRGVIYIYPKK